MGSSSPTFQKLEGVDELVSPAVLTELLQTMGRHDARVERDAWRQFVDAPEAQQCLRVFVRQKTPPTSALIWALTGIVAGWASVLAWEYGSALHACVARVEGVCRHGDAIFSRFDQRTALSLHVTLLLAALASVCYFVVVSGRRTRGQFAMLLQLTWEALERRAEYEAQEAKLTMIEEQLEDATNEYEELYRLCANRVLPEDVNEEYDRGYLLEPPAQVEIAQDILGNPEPVLRAALQGRHAGWTAAIRAASKIREPSYTLREFYNDVRVAFPELALYTVVKESPTHGSAHVSSGVSSADEYRRTIGALFAVYWLARIGIDGERGFSLGVDDDGWVPRQLPASEAEEAELVAKEPNFAKRLAFMRCQDWSLLQQLLLDSGMLKQSGSSLHVHVERTVGILALTAFHDVMKVEALLPTVDAAVAPQGYLGFKVGDSINDHDVALGYVLTYHAHLLPSFASLPPAQQKSVRFTQSKMSFNHGWLVQAEAPPKALFGPFKSVITSGNAAAADVAFYFVHWLTDLAGAEPTPLEGSEKFVLKFPHPVLGSFIRSFGVINELAERSETAVFESYLESAWSQLPAPLEPSNPPAGDTAIALMRLVIQAQTVDKQASVVEAFRRMHDDDRRILSEEMARTGAAEQEYGRSKVKKKGGPAILVYYSPAFMRSLTPRDADEALRLLAEVYRRSRTLWPLMPASTTGAGAVGSSSTVTVRIDQIKELKLDEIQNVYGAGESWLLAKRNDLEAVVERHPLDHMSELLKKGVDVTVLNFWRGEASRTASHAGSADVSDGGSIDSLGRGFADAAMRWSNRRMESRGRGLGPRVPSRRSSTGAISPEQADVASIASLAHTHNEGIRLVVQGQMSHRDTWAAAKAPSASPS